MKIDKLEWVKEEDDNEDDSPKITENITNDDINSIISTLYDYISELENENLSYKAKSLENCVNYLEKIKV